MTVGNPFSFYNHEEATNDKSDLLKILKQLLNHSYGNWEVIFQTNLEKEDRSDHGLRYFPPMDKTRGRPKFLITKV